MLFKYPLTQNQYNRFQHSTNDQEIRELCESAGCKVTNEEIIDGIETWYFRGRCEGTCALVNIGGAWHCVIRVQKKPWWLPWSILDWGFKKALV
jgi:hypothetical protein